MKKVYICSISLFANLQPMCYDTTGLYGFTASPSTRFPILSVLQNTASPLDEVEILTVNFKNEDTTQNMMHFKEEVVALGHSLDCIKTISIDENQEQENLLYLYKALVRAIPSDAEVSACITYGTKPLALLMQSAIQFASNYKESVTVRGIFYGEVTRAQNVVQGAKLYDVSGVYNVLDMIMDAKPRDLAQADQLLDTLLP